MAKATDNGVPKFDLSELSAVDSTNFSVIQLRLNEVMTVGTEIQKRMEQAKEDNVDPDKVDISDLDMPKATEVKALYDDLYAIFASTTIYVPEEWLTRKAPKKVDWSDTASFRFLKQAHLGDFVQAYNKAQEPEEVAGN